MASYFPDGSTVHIASALANSKTISSISNAATAVVSSKTHGLAEGDIIVVSSGWSELDSRVCQVGGITADTFTLMGMDTRDSKKFPANGGSGSFRKITSFVQIRQIAELQMSGGEPEYAEFAYLEDLHKQKRLVGISPRDITFGIGDDPTLAGYQAAKAASDSSELSPMRIDLPNGGKIYYNGEAHLDEVPNLTRGELMRVKFYYTLAGLPTRY